MYFDGVLIGAGTFLIIGLLHAAVVKTEYHWGVRAWPIYLAAGAGCIAASLFIKERVISALLCVLGFSLLWGIHELYRQRERVKRGWFPQKPD
ncbi:MAG TPA: DUF4491 family protein, partial [Feifaniaceae bacterium]|nr:DUF4491 family protein [Feifaniaceae bacterium]